jgi:hypothetical protein
VLNSPRTYPVAAAILSKLIYHLPSVALKTRVVAKLLNRFDKIPNTGYLQIWLQRITLTLEKSFPYDETLCKKVINDQVEIWNSEWLKNGLKKMINTISIIDQQVIETLPEIIDSKEVELFKSMSEGY